MDLKEIVKDNVVRFVRYRHGIAYYGVHVHAEETDYILSGFSD